MLGAGAPLKLEFADVVGELKDTGHDWPRMSLAGNNLNEDNSLWTDLFPVQSCLLCDILICLLLTPSMTKRLQKLTFILDTTTTDSHLALASSLHPMPYRN